MTRRGFYTLGVAGCAAGWAWVALAMHFPGQGVWSGCLWKEVLHVPCPACGVTRAIVSLLQGNVADALRLNPLGLPLAALLVLLPFALVADGVRRRDGLYRLFLQVDGALRRRRVFVSFVVLVLANWAWVLGQYFS